ncbi:hypothetical protein STCU_04859 [Strigomonas culicis]|uniref:Uncharacterized protein n=1 Tax=Strigomonas culicis TaxID=28005 RepID=S9VP59_9TRYP|nr:hypothetical protein STCU_04859 [Strigomonas culicis]|eukprot:EPY28831.1 hypothetical protein STCU_04859 [Strigomonas culicis]
MRYFSTSLSLPLLLLLLLFCFKYQYRRGRQRHTHTRAHAQLRLIVCGIPTVLRYHAHRVIKVQSPFNPFKTHTHAVHPTIMWSALSSDLSNLAKNLSAESTQFVNFISEMATDVVGQGGVYAGDEFTAQAQATPLDPDVVVQLQQDFATYCEPFSAAEDALFAVWAAQSPLSSAHVHARQAQRRAEDGGHADPAAGGFPDEPADTCRQKLLDYSEEVLDKYRVLVGDAVSPRQGSPSRRSAAPATAEGTPAREPAPAAPAAGASPAPTPGSPTQAGGDRPTLSEDTFFDRYFFRLAQRRSLEAELREQPTAAEGGTPAAAEGSGEEGPTHRLAKRFITAANAFVTNIDEVMTGRQAGGSDDDNVDPHEIDPSFTTAQEQKVRGLEELVHELQEALRGERRRVAQLTELLSANQIAIPPTLPTPNATPEKKN